MFSIVVLLSVITSKMQEEQVAARSVCVNVKHTHTLGARGSPTHHLHLRATSSQPSSAVGCVPTCLCAAEKGKFEKFTLPVCFLSATFLHCTNIFQSFGFCLFTFKSAGCNISWVLRKVVQCFFNLKSIHDEAV